MTDTQIYLISPNSVDSAREAIPLLKDLLEADSAGHIAAVQLALAHGTPEGEVLSLATDWRDIVQTRDRAFMLADHPSIAAEIGADGVHFTRADADVIAKTRDAIGDDIQIGVSCGRSRDRAMQAGQAGADYVAFGPFSVPVMDSFAKPAKVTVVEDWVMSTELPVVAEQADLDTLADLVKAGADFITLGPNCWEEGELLGKFAAMAEALSFKD